MAENTTITLDGITIAPGVLETIIAMAAENVDGVTAVLACPALRRRASRPMVDCVIEDGKLTCGIHIIASYGIALTTIGAAVQAAVSSALRAQLGVEPVAVDVFIDAIDFSACE
ncbi:MAG: Asp23/Gls24 family envelope stress response protein [Coriobacteriia bacterium]|nr:Asp23/Gls24 family envelope stress response protein [Coriobacteriia bacterium]